MVKANNFPIIVHIMKHYYKYGFKNFKSEILEFIENDINLVSMEERLQLVQRTLRDLVRFNNDKEDINLDVAFILASNDDGIIDEIRKKYHHKNFKWINDIDNQISDVLVDIYGLYSDN